MKTLLILSTLFICSCGGSKHDSNSNKNGKQSIIYCGENFESEETIKLYEKGIRLSESGKLNEGADILREAIELEPNNALLHHERGLILSDLKGNIEEAFLELDLSIELTDDKKTKMIRIENRGLTHLGAGNMEKACNDFHIAKEHGNCQQYIDEHCK